MSGTPKAVVFDYGQVLSLPQNSEAHHTLVGLSGLEPALFEQRYWAHRLAYDCGRVRAEEFWGAVLGVNGGGVEAARLRRLIEEDARSWLDVNEAVLRWALGLPGRGVRIALLSNMPVDLRETMRLRFGWLERFAAQVYSCEVGVAKPEAAIYLHCLRELRLEAAEALFVDDREENVAAARRLGIRAVRYRAGETPLSVLVRAAGLPG